MVEVGFSNYRRSGTREGSSGNGIALIDGD